MYRDCACVDEWSASPWHMAPRSQIDSQLFPALLDTFIVECYLNFMTVITSTVSTSFVGKPESAAPSIGVSARMAAGVSCASFWSLPCLPFRHDPGDFGSSNRIVRRDNSLVDSRNSRLPETQIQHVGVGGFLAVLPILYSSFSKFSCV